jgi:hypothetical protein
MAKKPDLSPWAPYAPVAWEKADAFAIKQVSLGLADAEQQVRAMNLIINKLCKTYDLSFCPGPDGDRETAMAEGRRFVGLQLVKLIHVAPTPISTLMENN